VIMENDGGREVGRRIPTLNEGRPLCVSRTVAKEREALALSRSTLFPARGGNRTVEGKSTTGHPCPAIHHRKGPRAGSQ